MSSKLGLPYVRKISKRDDLAIWVVDGSFVRSHIDDEFTNFGQHYRYKYIPANLLWIDRGSKSDELRKATMKASPQEIARTVKLIVGSAC